MTTAAGEATWSRPFARPADVSALDGQSVDYRGEFVVTLTHVEVVAVLPIEAGATFADGAYRARVERVLREGDAVRMFARSSKVRSIFNRSPEPVYNFFLRNRGLFEASGANLYRTRVAHRPWYPRTSAFEVAALELFFAPMARHPQAEKLRLDEAWLKDAELVIVRTVADGMVARTLTMKGVEISIEPKPVR